MRNYMELGMKIIETGDVVEGRNGKTVSLSGQSLSFDLRNSFPLVDNKFINTKHIIYETIWYLKGTDSIDYLTDNGIRIWSKWADENNSIGPTYGVQWRNFQGSGYDQIAEAVKAIKSGGQSRRIIVNGWAPNDLDKMALPPCLVMFQFLDRGDYLDMVVTQRSGDFCVGVPYDIAEMGLLLLIMSKLTNKTARHLTINYGDLHFYEQHINTFLTKQVPAESGWVDYPVISDDLVDLDDIKPEMFTWKSNRELPVIRYEVVE